MLDSRVIIFQRNYLNDQRQHEKLIPDLDAPVKCPVCKETIEKKRNLNLHFEKGRENKYYLNCSRGCL